MKILIADDEAGVRSTLSSLFSKYGECETAALGSAALDLFREAVRARCPYDIVCLDICMPEMEGQTLLRALRKEEAIQALLPEEQAKIVLLCEGDALPGIPGAFANQCDDYILKPVSKDRVEALLRRQTLIP